MQHDDDLIISCSVHVADLETFKYMIVFGVHIRCICFIFIVIQRIISKIIVLYFPNQHVHICILLLNFILLIIATINCSLLQENQHREQIVFYFASVVIQTLHGRLSARINPLNTKRRPLYLKTQFVPRSKHFISVIKTNHLTL